MKKIILLLLFCLATKASVVNAAAINFDAGVISILGVQVFQDAGDASKYYYLPQYPRLAQDDQERYELLMLKYVGGESVENGGIFHALIEFTLPDDLKAEVELGLKKLVPNAVLVGALPLLEPEKDDAFGGFRITSATLNDDGDGVSSNVITSGPAPLLESSKAAIAARLTQTDATLLMESLTGVTSDISVSVRGYYLAKVKGYNATIRANMDTVYQHKSMVSSFQQNFTRRQIFNVADEMIQDGTIDVSVVDQSDGLGIDSEQMEKIVELVTEKLTELMFDAETGWAKKPEKEEAVREGQIRDRLERSWLQKTFLNTKDAPYYSDDQFVLKRREDLQTNTFFLNLSKATTIRLPFDSTGNLGGFYTSLDDEDKALYFRTISLQDDASMQSRQVQLQIDSKVRAGFRSSFNSVAVNVRQLKDDGSAAFTKSIIFDYDSIDSNNSKQSFNIYRLGDLGDDWMRYDYQVAWNVSGMDKPLRVPSDEKKWSSSKDGIIPLVPPLERKELKIAADTSDFTSKGIGAAEVHIAAVIGGKPKFVAQQIIRPNDTGDSRDLTFYHDPNVTPAYQIIWHTNTGTKSTKFELLERSLLFLFSPDQEWLSAE